MNEELDRDLKKNRLQARGERPQPMDMNRRGFDRDMISDAFPEA